jgi:hypothetical protein
LAPADETEWVNLEDVRIDHLLLEDEWAALTGKKNQRIAREIEVDIRPASLGRWSQSPDGTRIWKVGLRGKGARALGIVFNRYLLKGGTKVYVFDPSGEHVLGAFTGQNNKESGQLAVSYLPGEELIVQMEVPFGTEDFGGLQIGSVRYAYLPVFDEKSGADLYFGNSGDCNVDINCDLGKDWQDLKHSVVRMINGEKCTGVLINNTRQDGKAYVYTAAHCVFDNNKFQPTIFYFNYESPSCDGPDGSTAQSISGATLIATGDTLENPTDADSLDFALLELKVSLPESFKPYYAGWDRSKGPAQKTTTIHHPSGDVKKIAVDDDPPDNKMHDESYFDVVINNVTYRKPLNIKSFWRVLEWDVATTEPGSSGCPLFNQNQQIIGTLTGGQATCTNQVNDYFTRFDYAWDHYPEPARQVKHWLDPDNTGVMSLAGKPDWNVSTQTIPEEARLNLYPNPVSGELRISFESIHSVEAEISIMPLTGQQLMKHNLSGPGEFSLDVSELPEGLYILHLRQEGRVESRRFIIAR